MWDMESGACIFTLVIEDVNPAEASNGGPIDSGVTSVVMSPDGKFLAAGSLDTVVRIWDAHTGVLLDKLKGHKDSVYSVAFSPDGRCLVSGSLDKTLKMWDMGTLKNWLGENKGSIPVGDGGRTSCMTTLNGHKVSTSFRRNFVISPNSIANEFSFALSLGLCIISCYFTRWSLDRIRIERSWSTILGS